MSIVGAIEAGGTKFVCAIATTDGELLFRAVFPTTSPSDCYASAMDFLLSHEDAFDSLSGIGIGHFGPLDVRRESPNYGRITHTSKSGWSNVRVIDEVRRFTDLPVAIDTDVNCAAIAEARWGAGAGLSDLVYVTVGTGIGAGILGNSEVLYGQAHPEVGHMFLPLLDSDREFEGACSFHGNRCAEGLAAGPAIEKRWNTPPSELDAGHDAWQVEAEYLAMLCINLTLVASPQRIILGGGVMNQRALFPLIHERFTALLNDYADLGALCSPIEEFIVPPGLGDDSGIKGACAIATRFCE